MPEVSWPSRSKGWNRRASCSSLRPEPVSSTPMHAAARRRVAAAPTHTQPPGAVVLDGVGDDVDQHLAQRAARRRAPSGRRARWLVSATPLRAGPSAAAVPARVDEAARSSIGSRLQRDAAFLDALQVEHLVDQRQQVLAGAQHVVGVLGHLAPAPPSGCRRSSCVKPITAFSGVRISWLMRERNSLFARLASSAACLSQQRLLGLLEPRDVGVRADDAARPAVGVRARRSCRGRAPRSSGRRGGAAGARSR